LNSMEAASMSRDNVGPYVTPCSIPSLPSPRYATCCGWRRPACRAAGTLQASNTRTPSVLREAAMTHESYGSSHDVKPWIAEALSEGRLYRDGERTWNKAETWRQPLRSLTSPRWPWTCGGRRPADV
jgi:hypothetical protein